MNDLRAPLFAPKRLIERIENAENAEVLAAERCRGVASLSASVALEYQAR